MYMGWSCTECASLGPHIDPEHGKWNIGRAWAEGHGNEQWAWGKQERAVGSPLCHAVEKQKQKTLKHYIYSYIHIAYVGIVYIYIYIHLYIDIDINTNR